MICEHCGKNKKDTRFESFTESNICDECLYKLKSEINWKCPNCKREKETEQDKVMVLCGCGYAMEKING